MQMSSGRKILRNILGTSDSKLRHGKQQKHEERRNKISVDNWTEMKKMIKRLLVMQREKYMIMKSRKKQFRDKLRPPEFRKSCQQR